MSAAPPKVCVAEEGHRSQEEVCRTGGGGPLHPVGEPAVGQGRQPLERQWPTGAVVAEPLEPDVVILVKPGVGVEGEALDEGTAAGRLAHRWRPTAPWQLDALQLEDVQRAVGRRLLLEHASSVDQAVDTTGHGDGECLHLGMRGPRQWVEAQLRVVQLLEDGLGDEHVEVGRQLQRRAEALDERARVAAELRPDITPVTECP